MKVWITKYCLTKGIYSVIVSDCGNGMVVDYSGQLSAYYHKPDWWSSEHEAIKQAEIVRDKKIASLKKAIIKLSNLSF